MNNSIQKNLLIWLIWLCVPLALAAQTKETIAIDLHTIKDTPLSYEVYNSHSNVFITKTPSNGSASWENGQLFGIAPGYHTLTYTPDPEFIGFDTLRIQYYREVPPPLYDIVVNADIYIAVYPTYIKAVDDFAMTKANTPITIDVLANDEGIGGGLFDVESISNVNSGTAICVPGCTAVEFTPEPGFIGIAHLNYTICDQNGGCDDAIVNITVSPTDEPMLDTIRIITSRDIPKVVLLDLINYEEDPANPPLYGSVDLDGDVPTYTPDADFAGYDYFNFIKEEGGNVYRRFVEMHILNVPPPNKVYFDDHAYTTENAPILINVNANDVGSNTTYASSPSNGTVTAVGNGTFEYIPNLGFTGIDVFTYTGYASLNELETATVYVHVNNQIPAAPVFNLQTPKNVPLVIDYNVPIGAYNFTISGQAAQGNASVQDEYEWNGQTVNGHQLLVYEPDANATPGSTDEFEVEYCVSLLDCPTNVFKIRVTLLDLEPAADQVCIGTHCVWPGDTNHDGAVNMQDLLPIGLCMGEVGIARENTTASTWYGQNSTDWNDPFERPGFDLKHIDTDGDSVITALDTAAIRANYGGLHSIQPTPDLPVHTDVILKYFGDETPEIGDLVSFEIWLGDSVQYSNPALDVHGITADLGYMNNFAENVQVVFPQDTWLAYDAPVLGMSNVNEATGLLEFGYTRTNGVSVNGYGMIARIDFVIVEDLIDVRLNDRIIHLPFELKNVHTMSSAGNMLRLPDAAITIPVRIPAEAQAAATIDDLKLFPNPTGDFLNVYMNGFGNEVESFEVYSINGQLMQPTTGVNAKSTGLDVSNWQNGLYIVRVVTNSGEVLTKKFEVMK